MRIWDLPVENLCDQHLLGEHAELHTIWSVITRGLRGWANHPETARWRGKLAALYRRHEAQVAEMHTRGFTHRSPLDADQATGEAVQEALVDSVERQRELLRARCANCRV